MTRDLGELRDHIDQIDAAIVALLAQRRRQRLDTHRTAAKPLNESVDYRTI